MRRIFLSAIFLTSATKFAQAQSPTASEALDLSLSYNPNQRDEWISEAVAVFSEKVAAECLAQNNAARAKHQFLCPENTCAESYSTFSLPESLDVSVSYSTNGRTMIHLTWQWNRHDTGTTGICYHPSLTPIVLAFENKLRFGT